MTIRIVIAASLLLSAAPALARSPSLERVADNARRTCEMSQPRIPAGKTVFATPRDCAQAGQQALASEQARRAALAGDLPDQAYRLGTMAEASVH